MKKNLIALMAVALLTASCGSDDISSSDSSSSSSDVSYDETTFDRTVTVTFNSGSNATVSGHDSDQQTVTISGDEVTIINNGDEKIQYELSGTATNGWLKIYSLKKQALVLNSVSITNNSGAAINIQGSQSSPSSGKCTYVILNGSNTLADGSSYSNTPDTEDEKAAFFSEGQLIFSGSGSLTVNAKGKSGIVSDDYISISAGTINVNLSSSCSVSDGDTLKPACMRGKDEFIVNGGTLTLKATGTGAKGISGDGTATFNGGTVNVTVTGSNFGSSSSGGMGPNSSSSNSVAAKGIKFDEAITVTGGTINVSASKHEGIESKGTLTISGGEVYSYSAADDAINSSSDMTISGGYIYAYAPSNDGLDANGNLYIKGGVIYACGASSPELAIDVNSEENKQLYFTGGTLIAIGGLESGASLSQNCYQASSWNTGTWYALTVGSTTYAFKTPSSAGSPLVVSGSSTPSLKSGVSVSGGTSYFNDLFSIGATISGGSSVSLSSYSGGNSGNGGGPGGRH